MLFDPVHETVLPNGLKILAVDRSLSPTATLQVWYKVGSRHERPGITGISHIFEHLMFKGTERFPKGAFDRILQDNGMSNNAFTSHDFTAYYEVLASDRLEIAMELEADRMQGLLLDPEEFRSELAVIREERKQTREDPPYGLLMESIEATAFTAHPYHWPIIGWMTDLETIEVEDVRRYYRDFYRPNNAVLIVVGDARPEQVVELAERHFGRIERGPEIPPLKVREPEQRGERMTSIRKAVQLPGLVLAYRSPASIAYEAKVLNVIEFLLFHGRSSRLYQRLVYREQLAADLGGGVQFRKDPSLFTLRATARPGVEVARLQDAIEDELRRLCREPVSPEELAKARRAIEADYLFSQESHYELAHNLGAEECRSSWRDYAAYLGENLRVGAEEIQAVANATFKDSARTIGRLIPDSRAAGSAEESA
ncbi:MAG: insulinase family protein [Candidatus Eisenbacteria bacterium]|nr:insulinase family protein [Candidatus Eisenbacteria bacterium]MCC7142700.1 insulinase family protein [Candidatus Eisenbacteria bacterium]